MTPIYDAYGVVTRVVDGSPDGTLTFQSTYDHQATLDDNARARSMGRVKDSPFQPFARYHPIMIEHWLQEDGMTRDAWRKLTAKEKMAFVERKVLSRDYRKFLRKDQKGLFV